MKRIYLDWAATAPMLSECRDAMSSWLGEVGNAGSLHAEGRRARASIDEARELLSAKLGCEFGEVIFTSSGTEAANLAVIGAALFAMGATRKRILMSAIEHHCVLATQLVLEKLGYEVQHIPVDSQGLVSMDWIAGYMGEDVLLVSVMHANNEIGTLQPVSEIKLLAAKYGALLHVDAVQTFCLLPWHVGQLGADLATVSAHKIGGPQGVGALFVRAGVQLQPIIVGGGQEREVRAGTENVAAIAGFGSAVRHYPTNSFVKAKAAARAFKNTLVRLNSDVIFTIEEASSSLESIMHLRIPGAGAESMLIVLDRLGVSASSGAACSSGSIEPSHVLLACGFSEIEAKEGLRFSFGRLVDEDDAIEAAKRVVEAAGQVRRKPAATR